MLALQKALVSILLAACSMFSFANDYPSTVFSKEEGFVDVLLSVSKYEVLKDGARRVTARSTHKGKTVGFAVELLPDWKAKALDGTEDKFYWGNARIISLGPDSDEFLNQLAMAYGIKGANRKFKSVIQAEVVGLANDPAMLETAPTRMKFFLGAGADESLYAEVFLHIDLKNKIVAFNEKDQEYRLPLIRSLGQ